MSTFFYDEQIRRYILQFLRIFSDFSIEIPPDENGTRVQKRVPIRYGDMQRQVAQILKENSENVTLSAPAMSGYITSIDIANDRRQDPSNVTPTRAMERVYNKETGLYEAELGNRYTIERYMPVPYNLTMNLDIWTTNTTDKMQLWEQIMVIFNSSVQLQTNDNPLDWSAITEVEMTDQNWSSRGVPQGSVSANDFSTFTFKIPIWINPPAKVKRQTLIEQIVTNVYETDVDSIDVDRIFDPIGSVFNDISQVIISPGDYRIDVSAIDATTSRVELLDEYGKSNTTLSWESLFAAYGTIDPVRTTLTLKTDDDIEDTLGDIMGTLEVSDTEQNVATFVIDADTLPTTIGSGAVTNLINPSVSFPGGTLPAAAVGQRYLLLTNDQNYNGEALIAQDAQGNNPWGSITAFENDIIEYNGTDWFISFNAANVSAPQYVVNSSDSQHYKFDNDEWVFTYLGVINPGYWRVDGVAPGVPVTTTPVPNTTVPKSRARSESIYDEQIRRYILQFLRIFSDFSIEIPPDENGTRVQKRVPIRYGDMSRMVAQILKENSENVTLSAPAMSGYITSIDMANDRRQDPMNVTPVRVMERVYNKETGLYESELGNRYTVERYMPVPYNLTMNLDIWTTNTTDKMQLWEQIMTIFNPSVQLQTNDNPVDWSAITEIELTDQNWSSRGVPQGSVSANDFSTFTFKVPIWINPPAKVKRQTLIEQIVTNIYDADVSSINTDGIFDPISSLFTPLEQVIISPGNYRIDVSAITATTSRVELLDEYGKSDATLSWESLFAAYGSIDPVTTTLILKSDDDIETTSGDILGSITVSSTEQNIATFTVDQDTLPSTIGGGAVTDLINPSVSYPGGTLPAAAVGQRYLLLTNDQDGGGEALIAQDAQGNNPWGSIIAFENDIIEYNGTDWFVSFNAATVSPPQYVVNSSDSQHYKFDGTDWVFTYLATFNPGYWRVGMTSELPPTQIGDIA